MPPRIAICLPCAAGHCSQCTAKRQPRPQADEGVTPAAACICRHDRAPRVAREHRPAVPAQAVDHVTPPPPTSAPFDLEAALAQAREEGESAGFDRGVMSGAAEAIEEMHVLRGQLEQARIAGAAVDGPIELRLIATFVLLELDSAGGLVSVLAAGGDLEALYATAQAWEPPLPGAYVEAWPVGGSEPVALTAPIAPRAAD